MKKKKLVVMCLAVVLVLSVAAIGCGKATPKPELPVLRVGMSLPLTGILAESAAEMADVFRMYLEETDGTLGGLPVQLFVEDTQTQAEMLVTKTRKLIEHDKVHLLTGPMLGFEAAAMHSIVVKNKIAHVSMAGSAAEDVKEAMKYPYTARISYGSFAQQSMPVAEYAYKELGYRKMATIGVDYAWGWETVGGFQYVFEELGGKIVQKLWYPTDTVDYAPFVTQFRTDVDAIWVTGFGAAVQRFVKAYADYGLKAKIPLLGSEDVAGEDTMRYYGDEALGITAITYSPATLDRPEMRKFVEANKEHFGRTPSFWADSAYNAAMWIDRALYRLQEEGVPAEELPEFVRNNAARFMSAMRATELPDAPSGHLRLDDYNSVVRDYYLVRLVKRDGKIGSEPFHTFKGVTQFWKYDPMDFFANPSFSREFPPLTRE